MSAVEGIKTGDWTRVRKSLKLRLAMRLKPDAATLVQIERILGLVDQAEAAGIGGTGEFVTRSAATDGSPGGGARDG